MKKTDKSILVFMIVLIVAAIIIATFISPFASSFPDGLEKVAEDLGFINSATSTVDEGFSLIPDYDFSIVGNKILQRPLAGLFGVLMILILFGIVYLTYRAVIRKKKANQMSASLQKHRSIFDARFKLIIALLAIIFIVSTSIGNYFTLLAYFFVVILCILLFRPRPLFFLKRAFIVFLFPLSVSVFIPFITPGTVLYGIELGSANITVTDTGMTIFLTTLIKSFLAILVLTSMVASSTDLEILHGLRRLHFPKTMVSIIFLMYRYLFLIRDEAKAGQLAINARVFKKSYKVVNKRLAFLAGNLLLKSFDRAENIYKSMESRGYDGNFYYIDDKKYGKKQLRAGIILLTVIVGFLTIIKYFELRPF